MSLGLSREERGRRVDGVISRRELLARALFAMWDWRAMRYLSRLSFMKSTRNNIKIQINNVKDINEIRRKLTTKTTTTAKIKVCRDRFTSWRFFFQRQPESS